MSLVAVFSPNTEPEQMAVVAMLEAHGVRCFVKNSVFGALYPGLSAGPLNRVVMVAEEDLPVAQELVREFEAG